MNTYYEPFVVILNVSFLYVELRWVPLWKLVLSLP